MAEFGYGKCLIVDDGTVWRHIRDLLRRGRQPEASCFPFRFVFVFFFLYCEVSFLQESRRHHCPGTRNVLFRLPSASQKRACLSFLRLSCILARLYLAKLQTMALPIWSDVPPKGTKQMLFHEGGKILFTVVTLVFSFFSGVVHLGRVLSNVSVGNWKASQLP